MNIHLETFESAARSLSRGNYGHGESSHWRYRVKVYEDNKSAKHLVGWMVLFFLMVHVRNHGEFPL